MGCRANLDSLLSLNELLDNLVLLHVALRLVVDIGIRYHSTMKYVLQLEALQLLHLSTRQVATVYHEAHEFLVVGNCHVVWLKHLSLESLLHFGIRQGFRPFPVRYNDGTQQVAILHYGSLPDIRIKLLQLVFYLVGLYVLAIGEDDDFLAPARNGDMTLGTYGCEVARMQEPILVYHLCRLLWTVVIALHDVCASGKEFSVYNLYLNARQGTSCTTRTDVVGTCEGYHGCCLGHAEAFQNVQSQRTQSAPYLQVECSTAADEVVNPATHLLPDGSEHEARESTASYRLAKVEQHARDKTGIYLLLDT